MVILMILRLTLINLNFDLISIIKEKLLYYKTGSIETVFHNKMYNIYVKRIKDEGDKAKIKTLKMHSI
jgi:hypothetical protein